MLKWNSGTGILHLCFLVGALCFSGQVPLSPPASPVKPRPKADKKKLVPPHSSAADPAPGRKKAKPRPRRTAKPVARRPRKRSKRYPRKGQKEFGASFGGGWVGLATLAYNEPAVGVLAGDFYFAYLSDEYFTIGLHLVLSGIVVRSTRGTSVGPPDIELPFAMGLLIATEPVGAVFIKALVGPGFSTAAAGSIASLAALFGLELGYKWVISPKGLARFGFRVDYRLGFGGYYAFTALRFQLFIGVATF